MKTKLHKGLFWVFLCLTPFSLLIVFSSVSDGFKGWLDWPYAHLVAATLFFLWFLSALYVLAGLLISKSFREDTLTRLAHIQERDEREEYVVGRAARGTFLFTLALLIALFSVSTFRFSKSLTDPQNKRFYTLTIANLDLSSNAPTTKKIEFEGKEHEIAIYDLPLSKTSMLLLLIVFQIGAYHWFARRSEKLKADT